MQNQPGSDLVLADCVRFWPNGSGPEASRCARIIRPASGQCFPADPDRMRIGSGMFTGLPSWQARDPPELRCNAVWMWEPLYHTLCTCSQPAGHFRPIAAGIAPESTDPWPSDGQRVHVLLAHVAHNGPDPLRARSRRVTCYLKRGSGVPTWRGRAVQSALLLPRLWCQAA